MRQSVAVIGLGLIGGSIFKRLIEAKFEVRGYDQDAGTRQLAAQANPRAICSNIKSAIDGVSLVIVATPLPAYAEVFMTLATLKFSGLVTDVASVKAPVADMVAVKTPQLRWVGGHPMAGTTESGFAASQATLFQDCAWVLCLDDQGQLNDWLLLAELLTPLGVRVVPTTSAEHDQAVARISHAPYVFAAALTRRAAAGQIGPLALGLGAGSFRDGSRVAASPVALSAVMCSANAAALDEELTQLITEIKTVQSALRSSDSFTELSQWFAPAHQTRIVWPALNGPAKVISANFTELLRVGRSGGWITQVQGDKITAVIPITSH